MLILFNRTHDLLIQDMNNAKLFSDEAANIYERAIGTLLKKNMLLYFSFADYEEVRCLWMTWAVVTYKSLFYTFAAF